MGGVKRGFYSFIYADFRRISIARFKRVDDVDCQGRAYAGFLGKVKGSLGYAQAKPEPELWCPKARFLKPKRKSFFLKSNTQKQPMLAGTLFVWAMTALSSF